MLQTVFSGGGRIHFNKDNFSTAQHAVVKNRQTLGTEKGQGGVSCFVSFCKQGHHKTTVSDGLKTAISEACCEADVAAGLSSRGSPAWQPFPVGAPRITVMGPEGPQHSMELEPLNLRLSWMNMRTRTITEEQPPHKQLAPPLPGGNLLQRPYPQKGWMVVISGSYMQEATRTTFILCEGELLVGPLVLSRSGRTRRESPGPRKKQEEVKMAPKILVRRFQVWPERSTLVNRGRLRLQQRPSGAHPCTSLKPCCFLLNLHTSSLHLPQHPSYTSSCQGWNLLYFFM